MRLRDLEIKHGGVHKVKQKNGKVNRGGDRFTVHDYEDFYIEHMPKDPKLIVELGVLTGSGLRIWSDYFPDAEIIGLDIFPENVKDPGRAKVFYWNQLTFDELDVERLLGGRQVDLFIDDGLHTIESQLHTYEVWKNFVDVYIIEDIDKGKTIDIPGAIQSGRIAVIK